MSSYTRQIRTSDSRTRRLIIESANDDTKIDRKAKKAAVHFSKKDLRSTAAALTLDDFGGRSDALGG